MSPEELLAFADSLSAVSARNDGIVALLGALGVATGAASELLDLDRRAIARWGELRSDRDAHTLVVRAGETELGWLSVQNAGGRPSEHLVQAARMTAAILAVELARNATSPRAREAAFWSRLASGSPLLPDELMHAGRACGVDVNAQYVCVVLAFEQPHAGSVHELCAPLADAANVESARLGVYEAQDALWLFVPAAREVDCERALTAASLLPRTLKKRAPDQTLCGVTLRVPFAQLVRAVADLSVGVAIVRNIFGFGRVVAYEALGAYPLLARGATADAFRAFATQALTTLRLYDQRQQAELEKTLRTYFSCGQNVKTTAESLHVHRHTIFYRLRQIGEIAGYHMNDPHDQLTLRLALAVDAVQE